jgi:hypothetical protein
MDQSILPCSEFIRCFLFLYATIRPFSTVRVSYEETSEKNGAIVQNKKMALRFLDHHDEKILSSHGFLKG